jgi:hypothetical protein
VDVSYRHEKVISQYREYVQGLLGVAGAEAIADPASATPDTVLGMSGGQLPSYRRDEGRRARMQSELDVLYPHLYGPTRGEVPKMLDALPSCAARASSGMRSRLE